MKIKNLLQAIHFIFPCLLILFILLGPTAGFCGEGWYVLLDGMRLSSGGATGSTPANDLLSVTMAHSIPTKPFSPGSYEFKISPGSVVQKREMRTGDKNYMHEVKGLAGALSLTYGLSHHFGLNFTAGYAKGDDGEMKKNIEGYSSIDTTFTGKHSNDRGYLFAANLVYDPYSNPEGFRLPIMTGISYTQASGRYEVPFTFETNCSFTDCTSRPNRIGHKGKETESYDIGGAGIFLSVSPQFNTGPVRWIPFAFVSSPLQTTKIEFVQSDLTTGESKVSQYEVDGKIVGGLGLGIVYHSWNLGYTYIPPISMDLYNKMEVHALTWSKNW